MTVAARVPFTARELSIGAAGVAVATAATVIAMGPVTVPLCAGIALAYVVWWRRGRPTASSEHDLTVAYVVGLVVLALHVMDEWQSGFVAQFPGLVGDTWSTTSYLLFNGAWFLAFVAGAATLRRRGPYALLIAWMFAIAAGVLNGAGHIVLSAWQGRLFPGTVTAPLLLMVGSVIALRLGVETAHPDASAYAARPSPWRRVLLACEAVLFTIIVPGSVTVWVPGALFNFFTAAPGSEPGWTTDVAFALLGMGVLIYARCVWDFFARGHGIPAPVDHPKTLVVSGLYRYVRNPMYVGVLLVLLGEVLAFPSWLFLLYIAVFFLIIHVNVLVYEEPNLRRRFGDDYVRYTAAVSRWVPGRPWRD